MKKIIFLNLAALVFLALSSSSVLAFNLPGRETLESNELSFIKSISSKYINVTPFPDYGPAYNFAKAPNGTFDPNGPYRAFCTQVIIGSLDKISRGQTLSYSDPEIQLMTAHFTEDFPPLYDKTSPWFWLSAAPGYDCLIAINLIRNVVPQTQKDAILSQIKTLADNVYSMYSVASYQAAQAANAGNSQGEELGITASFLNAAANLLPGSGGGAITDADRTKWLTRVKELMAYSYSQCPSQCPFKTGKWQIANHQMDPNPVYTQSLLTSYGEIAMIYNQLGKPLPADIFTSQLSSAVANINSSLSNNLDANFRLKGPVSFVDTAGNSKEGADYSQFKYTIVPWDTSQQSSSVPNNNLDAFTQFLQTDGTLKSYIIKGNKMWHYTCKDNYCVAQYVNAISDSLASSQNLANFTIPFPTTGLDTFSQFSLNDNNTKNFYFKNDRVWYLTCTAGVGCTAQYTKTIASLFSTMTEQQAFSTPLPTSNLDTVNQFYKPSTNTVKGYVTKGNTIWAFECDTGGLAGNCHAGFSRNIADNFAPLANNTNWPVPLPTDNWDAFDSFYQSDGTLKGYVYKGDRAWHYLCNPAGTCQSSYTKKLIDFWHGVAGQFRWPMEAAGSFYQFSGTVDWGMDATFQNSAYAAMAAINPTLVTRYQQIQNEQISRGYNVHPPYPVEIVNGQWTWDKSLSTAKGVNLLSALTDGWLGVAGNGMQPNMAALKTYDNSAHWPTIDEKINSHWWLNLLTGFNSSMAYMLVTDNHYLARFSRQGDLDGNGLVNIFDLRQFLSAFTNIFDYNQLVGNYGK